MKSLTIAELETVAVNSQILRSCNDIPFEMANDINGNAILAEAAIENHSKSKKLLDDREKEAMSLEDATEKEQALAQIVEDRKTLENKTYDVDLHQWDEKDFKALNIKGDKVVMQPSGHTLSFSYRESYFTLRKFILN